MISQNDRAVRLWLWAGSALGIVLAGAVDSFRAWVEALDVPVVSTLKGVGTVPTRDARHLGMLGMHGSKAANLAVQAGLPMTKKKFPKGTATVLSSTMNTGKSWKTPGFWSPG